jgi:hypothetical protein
MGSVHNELVVAVELLLPSEIYVDA